MIGDANWLRQQASACSGERRQALLDAASTIDALTTDASRIDAIGEHAQELGRADVLHEQQLDEIARILQVARRRVRSR